LRLNFFDVDAGAVVGDFDVDLAAFVNARIRIVRGATCPCARVRLAFHPVVQRVCGRYAWNGPFTASRIVFVQFRLGAIQIQIDFFAQRMRHVAHDSRNFCSHAANRLHARLHDIFLQLRRDEIQALRRTGDVLFSEPPAKLQNLIARQNQFANEIHQASSNPTSTRIVLSAMFG